VTEATGNRAVPGWWVLLVLVVIVALLGFAIVFWAGR
jgi:hypothetical protein